MQTITRPGDLTIHIYSDCGGLIVGEFVRDQQEGVVRYYHTYRCERRPVVTESTTYAQIGDDDDD